MPLIDTHAHLFDDRFAADLADVVQRAAEVGVNGIVAVGIDAVSNRASIAIANRFPNVLAAVGIQPNHVAEAAPDDWDEVVRLVETEPRVAAVGETGLDRYWDRSPFAMQEEFFARHLELARKHDKPVVIHCREAEADVVTALTTAFNRHGPIRGVMHSYTGDVATARACLDMGLHVSCAGMVTFKTAGDLRAVAKTIPVDRILVETDCPYLAPQAVRGKRNEPAYVVHTATVLAAERGEPFDDFARQTTANAKALFGIG